MLNAPAIGEWLAADCTGALTQSVWQHKGAFTHQKKKITHKGISSAILRNTAIEEHAQHCILAGQA
jgi:hypothetical protein